MGTPAANAKYAAKLRARSQEDIEAPAEKRCTKCGETKPIDAFGKANTLPDGRKTECKVCRSLATKAARAEGKIPPQPYTEAKRQYHAEYYARNHDRIRRNARAWRRGNPDKLSDYNFTRNKKRRARLSGSEGKFSRTDWDDRLAYFDNRCAYCLRHTDDAGPMTVEHMLPLSKGGAHDIDNIVPACKSCNSSKHAHTLLSFVQRKPVETYIAN